MAADNSKLFDLLVGRGLDLSKEPLSKKALLEPENHELLMRLAGMWHDHKSDIVSLIEVVIHPMRDDMIFRAHPAEVLVLRQSLLDISSLVSILQAASEEAERRKKKEDAGGAPKPADDVNRGGD